MTIFGQIRAILRPYLARDWTPTTSGRAGAEPSGTRRDYVAVSERTELLDVSVNALLCHGALTFRGRAADAGAVRAEPLASVPRSSEDQAGCPLRDHPLSRRDLRTSISRQAVESPCEAPLVQARRVPSARCSNHNGNIVVLRGGTDERRYVVWARRARIFSYWTDWSGDLARLSKRAARSGTDSSPLLCQFA